MFNKFELIGAGLSVMMMAVALYLIRVETSPSIQTATQPAQVASSQTTTDRSLAAELADSIGPDGTIQDMVIDDIKIGTGAAVAEGDTVSVHYIGTLQNGTEFDNSRKRGSTFEFTVGEGRVIPGWEQGVIGMKVGGQRTLVIPPELAYGERGIGPIPPNSTLIFVIELLTIENE